MNFNYSVDQAQQIITQFREDSNPPDLKLAAAHYTLAALGGLSLTKIKMHLNTAIALLQPPTEEIDLTEDQAYELIQSYFLRAELAENSEQFASAARDYQRILNIGTIADLQDDEIKLIAGQASLALAELFVTVGEPRLPFIKSDPMEYIALSVVYLSSVKSHSHNADAVLSYVYQTAGKIQVQRHPDGRFFDHFGVANVCFSKALSICHSLSEDFSQSLLGDKLSSMANWYIKQEEIGILKNQDPYLEYVATQYFALSILFRDSFMEDAVYEPLDFESLFICFQQILNLPEKTVTLNMYRDMIDAMIYAYIFIKNDVLFNSDISYEIHEYNLLDTFAHYLYSFIEAYYQKAMPGGCIFGIADKEMIDWSPVIKIDGPKEPCKIYQFSDYL